MSLTILKQSLRQMWGIIALEYRYHGSLPSIDNYCGEVQYSLPFRGKWVVVNGGVTQETSHSWEIPTQRYAYDFIMLDEAGSSARDSSTRPESFYCYGRDIIAPADGVVVEVLDGCPDSPITPERAASCAARDLRGNYVLIQHAEHEYALLAHLQAGSISAAVGQTVKRGDRIAQCGNSGNTSEPHLHFQIQAERNFFTSPGLPIAFDGIKAVPAPNYSKFDDRPCSNWDKDTCPPYITRGQMVENVQE